MEVVITADPDAAAALAADAVERLVTQVERPVLGLATGSSPLGIYRELIDRHRAGRIDFAAARAFLLDEYVGLPASEPESYASFIRREFAGNRSQSASNRARSANRIGRKIADLLRAGPLLDDRRRLRR